MLLTELRGHVGHIKITLISKGQNFIVLENRMLQTSHDRVAQLVVIFIHIVYSYILGRDLHGIENSTHSFILRRHIFSLRDLDTHSE